MSALNQLTASTMNQTMTRNMQITRNSVTAQRLAETTSRNRSACSQFTWLLSVEGGWLCSLCSQQHGARKLFVDLKRTGGTWVTTPCTKVKTRKLKERATQHASAGTAENHHKLDDINVELSRQHRGRDEATASMIKKFVCL